MSFSSFIRKQFSKLCCSGGGDDEKKSLPEAGNNPKPNISLFCVCLSKTGDVDGRHQDYITTGNNNVAPASPLPQTVDGDAFPRLSAHRPSAPTPRPSEAMPTMIHNGMQAADDPSSTHPLDLSTVGGAIITYDSYL